jgi:hypothetical protein
MKQHLHVSSKSYRLPDAPSYVVLVWTHDDEDPRRYRVNDVGLELLRRGWTPEKIGLEPLEEDDRD